MAGKRDSFGRSAEKLYDESGFRRGSCDMGVFLWIVIRLFSGNLYGAAPRERDVTLLKIREVRCGVGGLSTGTQLLR